MGPDDSAKATRRAAAARERPSFSVSEPKRQSAPLIFASPHSGSDYPEEFLAATRIDLLSLRCSEDAFIDEIFESVVEHGAPLLKAHFPRSYVDPNREPWELDPAMFDTPLPDFANASSPRVAAGLGTVARVVTDGEEIYHSKLAFEEVAARIETHYQPYHEQLEKLIATTVEQFGGCLLIDCHSMPSIGGPMDSDKGHKRVDFVLGDRFGMSCAPIVINTADRFLKNLGYSVRRNVPYAGGFTTRHYGRPRQRVHALQIEINRSLYMDELEVAANEGLPRLKQDVDALVGMLTRLERGFLVAA